MPTELKDHRHYTLALRPGARLGGIYGITDVLGESSAFALTYLAEDQAAFTRVVIKEFLPRTLAGRAPDELTVRPHSVGHAATLSRSLRRFGREAELLADIAHPNIPRVRHHFEANGTAYLVLQHYEGQTLAGHAAAAGGRLPVDRAVGLVIQLLQGIEALHAEGVIHGHITPDNVFVDVNSRVLVLGLGATRHVVGQAKEPAPGFAPIEQYASREVGPWTDVYACGAVLYRLITGLTPPSAVERSAGASIQPPGAAADVSSSLARTIMSALAQLPDARPHSAEEFRRRLDTSLALSARTAPTRIPQRAGTARYVAEPEPVGLEEPEIEDASEAELQQEPRGYDNEVIFPDDGPGDRVRRVVRLVLAASGAAAAILLAVSVIGGRKGGDDWVGAGVVAASPAPPLGAQTPPAPVAVPRVDPASLQLPPESDSVRSRVDTSSREPDEPAPNASRVVAKPEASRPSRPRPTTTTTKATAAESPATSAQRERASQPRPPAPVAVKPPAQARSVELPPVELLGTLRERLAQAKEKAEFGEYASARRILSAGLQQVATLNDRYVRTPALVSLRHELESAMEGAAASCKAENEIIRKRNGKPLPCE